MKAIRAVLCGVVSALFLLGSSGRVGAADVKLIRQPRRFPITIAAPGSYRLKGNITVPDADTTAVVIAADNVTLDLNGYAIRGPTVCTGTPVSSCVPTGTGNGIFSAGRQNITVRNGIVEGMGYCGVHLGCCPPTPVALQARVEKVLATSNGFCGISTSVGIAATLTGNVAAANGDHGIGCGTTCTLLSNTATGNASTGIAVSDRFTLIGNTATGNGGAGITAGSGGLLSANTSANNAGVGISASADTSLLGNSVTGNVGLGLTLGPGAGYGNNVVNANNAGNANPQVSGGTEMGINVCGGDTSCP